MTAALLGIGLSSAFVAGLLVLRAAHPHARTVPVLTLACFVVVGAVSLTQLAAFPRLLGLLMRDSYGGVVREPWRLVTSLLVQDGGWAGTFFNLLGLLAVGSVAELLFGRWRWGLVGFISFSAAQAVALAWQPVGAGNSMLNFGLGGAICVLTSFGPSAQRSSVPGVVGLLCISGLLLIRDIHGAAGAAGALTAVVLLLHDSGIGPAGQPSNERIERTP